MDTYGRPGYRQRRGRLACDGAGPHGRGRRADARGGGSSLGGRTATRALVALGTYVAQDLRDAEGLTRPLLRRAAFRLALSRREPARRLGGAYLRLDPLAAGEGRQTGDAIEAVGYVSESRELQAPPVAPFSEAGGETPPC
jgi:hypothetical protein